jgi:hypothetical protein
MNGRLRFLNPYNNDYDAVTVSVQVTAQIEVELLHGFTIAAKVLEMQMKVTDSKAFFMTPVTVKELDVKV